MTDVIAGQLPAEERAVLRDGTTVHIHPVRSADAEALAVAFDKLSPEARYRRFLAPMKSLSGKALTYLTRVDHVCHEALVAVEPDDGEIVGVSRYVSLDTSRREAEVAIVVADGWRGKGLGTLLLAELAGRAQASGVERFVAICLNDNRAAVDVLGSLGPTSVTPEDGGLRELTIELSAEGAAAALRRALGHAGRGEVTFLPLAHPEVER